MIHKILYAAFLLVSIILFSVLVPAFWLFNLLRFCFKNVYPEVLKDKVILITGASRGIGEQLAFEFAKEGACLVLVARRKNHLLVVAEKAKAMGSPDVIVIPADISKLEDCKKFICQTIKHFGKLDYLVNNAAIGTSGLFEDQTLIPCHASVMDINFWGPVYTTRFALPHLRRSRGKIITICSCGSWFATPRASKAAVLSFFETLRMEVGSDVDIRVVTPGMIETSLTNEECLEEGNALWIPRESATRCAKAIVNSTKRGDIYFTVPSWMKTIYLWKMLCPEIVNCIMKFLFIYWPKKISSKKSSKIQHLILDSKRTVY